jgi:NAD-dependent dihydropyrimidine dehydrogenase PreA subunit
MKKDAIFIGVEVDDAVVSDPAMGAKLDEVCPVSIFRALPPGSESGVEIVDENIDECVLCGLCIDAAPAGTVKIHKLYSGEVLPA